MVLYGNLINTTELNDNTTFILHSILRYFKENHGTIMMHVKKKTVRRRKKLP